MTDLKHHIIDVERAITELRHGQPITIFERGEGLLIQSIEGMTQDSLEHMNQLVNEELFVVLTKTRGQILYKHEEIKRAIKLPFGELSLQSIRNLSGLESQDEGHVLPYVYAGNCSCTALKLTKLSKMIPALIVSHITTNKLAIDQGIYTLTFKAIEEYEEAIAQALQPICTTPIALKNAPQSTLTVFRAEPGIQEHYAIIVGTPHKEAPITRIHSACFTGDLLDSLKCDCGPQLQESLHYMSENGGGILLYMKQEGRGIGFSNKMRTYGLQHDGMDTVQANEYLGFDDDERPYLPAANMLKFLGYNNVKLMTNNPRKVKGLAQHGIKIKERIPLIIKRHTHNENYLHTKFNKLGHISE